MNIKKRSNMTIAMFGHKQCLSCEGGVETVVRKLSVRMSEKKCTVTCYDRRTHGKNSILPSNKSSYKNIEHKNCPNDSGMRFIAEQLFDAFKKN